MNLIKKIYCRVFQFCFRAALPILPYREPKILNEMSQIGEVLKEKRRNYISGSYYRQKISSQISNQ